MSRIVIAGTCSHSGKTTIACGLLEVLRYRGVNVSAYKTGPDYIDPQFLRRAGRCEAYNLDTWLMSEQKVTKLFTQTSRGTAIIEGAMGLYDGGIHSTAGIAKLLDAPVILVMDARSLGESAGAVALGFREYDRDVDLAGVILNRVSSDYHVKIIADELSRLGIKCLGALRRDDGLVIPERHLGLNETAGYEGERLRAAVEAGIDVDEVMKIARRGRELKCADERRSSGLVSAGRDDEAGRNDELVISEHHLCFEAESENADCEAEKLRLTVEKARHEGLAVSGLNLGLEAEREDAGCEAEKLRCAVEPTPPMQSLGLEAESGNADYEAEKLSCAVELTPSVQSLSLEAESGNADYEAEKLRCAVEPTPPMQSLGLEAESGNADYEAEKLSCAVELTPSVQSLGLEAESGNAIYDAEKLPSAVNVAELHAAPITHRPRLGRVRVGIARDEAFTFFYPESLGFLGELGAELVYFSPLHDGRLPDAEGYIFGGGFPEMFAGELAGNASMLADVRDNVRPVLAECGGYMYLCRSLKDLEGRVYEMAGIIPADAEMTGKPVLGYMEAQALHSNILCDEGMIIRGHEFHYSRIVPEIPEELCAFSLTRRNTHTSHFGGYSRKNILASYLHINFFGYPELAENFLSSCTYM